VILCGGLGSRLSGVVADRPKALVDVCGRPILEWSLLGVAQRAAIRRVVLATGYRSEMIEDHFGDQVWCGITISYSPETAPLGTGGALRLAAPLTHSEHVLVLNGDSYCRYDWNQRLELHLTKKAAATISLAEANDPRGYGSAALGPDADGTAFREKSTNAARQLASAGVYLLRRDVINAIPTKRKVSLEVDIFPSLAGSGLYGVAGSDPFFDIGTPEGLSTARRVLETELQGLDCD